MNEIQRAQYLAKFPDKTRQAALDEARENRKFEIELYWKRATYFWAFIAAAFAGYFVWIAKQPNEVTISYIIGCLGFIFSVAWYFVNRGSKYWQENWETHVDLLEDDLSGPIYKTVVQKRLYSLCHFQDAYPFSVSKINQLLSLFLAFVWLVLVLRTAAIAFSFSVPVSHLVVFAMSAATLLATLILLCKGVTENSQGDITIGKFYQRDRNYS